MGSHFLYPLVAQSVVSRISILFSIVNKATINNNEEIELLGSGADIVLCLLLCSEF